MKFFKSIHAVSAVVGAVTAPKDLDIDSPKSIRNVAATIAFDAMSYYQGNLFAPNSIDVGDLQDPYYWWVAGALWGAMLDYYHYTNDPSYNDVVMQALLAPSNLGANFTYMPPEHEFEEGNDDLFFWASAVLSAAERNFPQPNRVIPAWIDIAAKVFDELAGRWSNQHCGGGLYWQIYPTNPNGIRYKNSVSNGGFFQLAARLARATGNDTYLSWAEQVWDWSMDVGFIDAEEYHIWDGADHGENCTKTNQLSFTYTTGIYLYGAAVMANYTEEDKWAERAEKIIDGAAWFFTPPGGEAKENIMYEAACETVEKCNADMSTFKGYLSRFMWQSTVMLPSLRNRIERYLIPSAQAAAESCTGGETGRACGMKWWDGDHDGNTGLGQQMCALETIQGLLIQGAAPPLTAKDIRTVRAMSWKKKPLSATVDAAAQKTTTQTTTKKLEAVFSGHVQPTERSDGGRLGVCAMPWVVAALGTALATWGLA